MPRIRSLCGLAGAIAATAAIAALAAGPADAAIQQQARPVITAALAPAPARAAPLAGQAPRAAALDARDTVPPGRSAVGTRARAAAAVPQVAQHPYRAVCAWQVRPGESACLSLRRTDVKPHKGLFRPGVTAQTTPPGYGPSDLQSAYNLPSSTAGKGATVAVVDAHNDPVIASDLATYRSQYGLPPCTQASGCFRVVNQNGQASPLPADAAGTGWDQEESLDVDMVSAICPNCHIILVEANSSNNPDLYTAEDAAVNLGAKFVSNSWAACEYSGETSEDRYFNHPGVAIGAASGDWGYLDEGIGCGTPSYPATSQYVTAVGGTSLVRDSSISRGWAETVWASGSGSGTGSGCSVLEPQPSWQAGVTSGCANRADNDVSAVADPNTGVAVYDSYTGGGWGVYGGTSVGTPVVVSAYALAGLPASGSYPASYLYAHYKADPSAFNDVTSGANGTCTPSVLCTADPGWDGPTGLGTPDGVSGFAYAQTGSVTGKVTDTSTGNPIADATVATPGLQLTTGSDGTYTLAGIPAGSLRVSVSGFGYQTQTQTVTVTANQTTSQNFALTGAPHETVSGTVTAATGTAWPLYARVTWSDGDGHSGMTFTTPVSGQYRLSLLENASYTLAVTPLYPGYTTPAAQSVSVGTSNVTQNFTAGVDLTACTAIGYHPVLSGTTQTFDGTKAPAGWQVTNTNLHLAGYTNTPGWVFNDPGSRPNHTGGTGGFAIVDSDHAGQFHYQDTELVSPVINMSADTTPAVQFATDYEPAVNSTATVDVSVDGGKTWANAWTSQGFPGAPGPATVTIPLPRAAGKSQVRVRFGYTGQWSQWWEIDNVFLGNRTCHQGAGGLLIGRAADSSGNAINGATVASATNPTEKAITLATPGDSAINGGFYDLFVTETGSHQYTASASGYTSSTQTATITAGRASTLNFTLASGSGGPRTAGPLHNQRQACTARRVIVTPGSSSSA